MYASRAFELQISRKLSNYAWVCIVDSHLHAALNEVMHGYHKVDLQDSRLEMLGQMTLDVVDP